MGRLCRFSHRRSLHASNVVDRSIVDRSTIERNSPGLTCLPNRASGFLLAASALPAHSTPHCRLARIDRAGLRPPLLDRHQAGLHEVHAREEARHLFAAAGRVMLPHHLVHDAPEAVSRLLVEESVPECEMARWLPDGTASSSWPRSRAGR